MGNTVAETNNLINDAFHAACKAQSYLDWVLSGAPRTEPYEKARTAAATAYPHLSNAIDVLRTARVHGL